MSSPDTPHLDALRWLLNSPPLLAHTRSVLPPVHQHELQRWMQTDWHRINRNTQLQDTITIWLSDQIEESRDKRLGHYFELLIKAWLLHSSELELLASNIVIRSPYPKQPGKPVTTCGELDFIVLHKQSNEHIHMEATVKFYMKTAYQWLGPNTRDSLAKRHQRLTQHQFPLINRPETAELLSDQQLYPAKQVCLSRGRLFYPAELLSATGTTSTPHCNPYAHPDHQKGFWCHADRIMEQFPSARWLPMEKQDWLSAEPHQWQNPDAWLSSEHMLYYCKEHWQKRAALPKTPDQHAHTRHAGKFAVPFQCLMKKTAADRPDPFFLCPKHWPDTQGYPPHDKNDFRSRCRHTGG